MKPNQNILTYALLVAALVAAASSVSAQQTTAHRVLPMPRQPIDGKTSPPRHRSSAG